MKYIFKFFSTFYNHIISSIAFFPVIISLGFTLLALIVLSVEGSAVCVKIKENISYLLIKDIDTARTMLSTLIGGIFSLTVFSFSMVMVVLSQASSNFSPRLLPGLISNKKHQVILGIYTGTLLYSLIVLMNVKAFQSVENSVGISILLGVFFGVSCTGLFVYFIHTISQEIQIQNILNQIYNHARQSIKTLIEKQKKAMLAFNTDAESVLNFEITSKKSGYYKNFSKDLIVGAIKEHDNILIEILPSKNSYVYEGSVIVRSSKALSTKECDNLLFSLIIDSNKHATNDYNSNMTKIMEVAIRAMSPGINDPGTAIDAINKLGLLLNKALRLKTNSFYKNENLIVKYREICYDATVRQIFQPIRQYSKKDSSVMQKLLQTLTYVYENKHINIEAKNVLESELKALKEDAQKSIFNQADLKTLLNIN